MGQNLLPYMTLLPERNDMKPGEFISNNPTIELNKDSEIIAVSVINTGDRPIQVGSHFHFFEVNKFLRFPRRLAFGCRLNIPSGTAVRFEPGEKKDIELIRYQGHKNAFGFNSMVNGSTENEYLERTIGELSDKSYLLD